MRRLNFFLPALFILSSCAEPSPFSALRIPDLPQIEATQLNENEIQLTDHANLSPACRRDAMFLKAAKIALESSQSHFQIIGETKTQYASINDRELPETITIGLCSGVCSGMFSASSVAHILVPKFDPARRSLFAAQKPAKCLQD